MIVTSFSSFLLLESKEFYKRFWCALRLDARTGDNKTDLVCTQNYSNIRYATNKACKPVEWQRSSSNRRAAWGISIMAIANAN